MAGDIVAISVKKNLILPKDQAMQPWGIRQIGTPGLDGLDMRLVRFSIQEDIINTVCDAQGRHQGGVLLGPFVPVLAEEIRTSLAMLIGFIFLYIMHYALMNHKDNKE
ncbi:hypothetical protein HU200_053967 [Digitaria exilis]|uniref:Uncharacterized protein n=1 Tax=Digitaria exilis TaxID=1010633 RepID=A0A835ANA7_9POAL|nr:hypothetical protein HU200_053967 [Digitaria exilis]